MKTLIKNAIIVNENLQQKANLVINDAIIEDIFVNDDNLPSCDAVIDAEGLMLLPGVIDDQVHFRDPGLTHKGDIYTGSRAAAAGGVTSFMDMPNTIPQTVTISELNKKFAKAETDSLVNYSFYMGANNFNIRELAEVNPKEVCGIKMFLGSSTGDMLVSKQETILDILRNAPTLVAAHCENDEVIAKNLIKYKAKFGDNIPIKYHPEIRSVEACYSSSARAIDLASKTNAHLHILHVSTQKEMSLFEKGKIGDKQITSEACVHHLWFNNSHYDKKGTSIKWNPAIKSEDDRLALLEAVNNDYIDIIATDHAPHTITEKNNIYTKAPSGAPFVQHSLVTMLELANKGEISIEKVVDKMCHKPAELFKVEKRGYIRKGFYADLVLVNPDNNWQVDKENILYKCGWSPVEGQNFKNKIQRTIVNGKTVFLDGNIIENKAACALKFDR